MALIGEPASKTHLAQGERWIAEQLLGEFQAALQDVLVRAASGAGLEQLREMEGAHARSLREFFQMNVAIEVGVNELHHAIETYSRHPAVFRLRGRRIRQMCSQSIADQFAEDTSRRRSCFRIGLKRLHQPRNLGVLQIEL